MRKMIKNIENFLKLDNFDIVAFYPYTSVVIGRILEQNHNYETEEANLLTSFFNEVLKEFPKYNIKNDNKIVVELRLKKDNFAVNFIKVGSIFLGYYDNKITLGIGVYQLDNYTQKYNQVINPDFEVGDTVIYDSCGIDIKAVITEIRNEGRYPIIVEYDGNSNPVNKNQIKLFKKVKYEI